MGSVNSTGTKLDKALAADLPENERYFGLENFGNTCYCNSVLQALYFCEPFRRAILDYAQQRRHPPPSSSTASASASGDALPASASATAPLHPVPSALSAISVSLSSSVADSNYAPSSSAPPAAAAGAGAAAPYANGAPQHNVYNKSQTGHLASSSTAAGAATSSDPAAALNASAALDDTMLTALADLFTNIASQKKRTGSVPPKSFINKLRQENELFSSYMHQDAHEFLNFILNSAVECLEAERRKAAALRSSARRRPRMQNGVAPHLAEAADAPRPDDAAAAPDALDDAAAAAAAATGGGPVSDDDDDDDDDEEVQPGRTFVHELFEGQLSNEVRCLCCETITRRVESFFDLSVDVEQNSSLTACLRSFSSTELLEKQDKFFCDACCSLQEAERRMRIKRLPRILSLHLKRFKYVEQLGKYKKLSYRVVFPLELRLCNTSDDAEDPDRLYSLFAVVVHVGSGPNQGHYVSLIKSHGQWLMFDDDCVEPKDESEIQSVYGVTQDSAQSTEAGYILFYEQTSTA